MPAREQRPTHLLSSASCFQNKLFTPFLFGLLCPLSFLITVGFKLPAVLLYRAQRDVFLSSHAPAGGSPGMHGHPGLCSCARSGVAPRVLEGLVAVPLGMCMGDEVFRVSRAARNTLWELCALWKAKTPLKSIGTCCRTVRPAVASGWPRGCRGRRVGGHRGCPMPWGCQQSGSQAGGSTQRPGHRGAAWGQLGMRDWKVWGQSSRVLAGRALVWVVMHVHPCSHVFSHAWRCPFLGVCFRVGRTRDAELGRALGWFLGLARGARGQTGSQIPLTPPAPCHRHFLGLCHQAVPATSPHPAGKAVPPS